MSKPLAVTLLVAGIALVIDGIHGAQPITVGIGSIMAGWFFAESAFGK